ncbi:hypothetical protein D3C71_1039330 [compost metagenome]
MGQQLERIQPRAELLQADPAAQRRHLGQELLGIAQVGEDLRFRRVQPQALARHAMGLQFAAQGGHHLRVVERFGGDLDHHLGGVAGAFALAQHADGVCHHPAVDLGQQPVFLGNAQERGRAEQLAIVLQAQVRLVQLQRLALQAQYRLVMQLEAVAAQRFADAGDPALDAFFLHPVDGGRIEDARGIAQLRGSLLAFGGARQDLADAGDLLAHLHAADADGDRGRALADAEHLGGERITDLVGQGHRLRVGAFGQDREAVLAKAGHLGRIADAGGQHLAQRTDQGIGRIQTDVRQQARVVVRLDQQQAELAFAAAGLGHRVFHVQHEGGAVEQAGDLVALAQVLDLAGQFRVELHPPAAEHHLQAGFAFVAGLGEFHGGREHRTVLVARIHLVLRGGSFALAHRLEQLLEAVHVLRGHHVQQRDAFDVVEGFVAEHLQVGLVGADMHAFVDVGDRVARGGDQRVAAAFGLAHLRFDAAQPAARVQVGPLVAHHRQQVLGAMAQGDGADAIGASLDPFVLVDRLGQQDHRDVLAAGRDLLGHLQQRDALRGRGQHQVDRLAAQDLGQLLAVLGARRAHGDAAVAQRADDGFSVLPAVIHDQQADGDVIRVLHSLLPGLQT